MSDSNQDIIQETEPIDPETIEQVGELIDTHTAIDAQPISGHIVETSSDLKASLSNFVQHYLQRIRGHKDIEDILKEALIERLPEADFEQIEKLLNTVMRNSNNAVEKVMAPFIPQKGVDSGDTINNFLVDSGHKTPIEEKILKDDQMTPEMIKGLYDLAQMMNAINSQKPIKK